jgi:tRNA dimethylallyltransferase
LALALARRLGGEVISADSRQIYRDLSAGTAKPTRDERGLCEGVPYHLIDCVALRESFDAARFARLAGALAGEILGRGRRPIVAGGTGLYIRALLDGLCELPVRDESLRRRLEDEASRSGWPALHRRLSAVDPEAAKAIPAGNRQRLIRALEVHELTGRPISRLWKEPRLGGWEGPVTTLRLDRPIEELRARITERAEKMWPGMLAEARALAPRLGGDEPGLESLGYASALACQRGEISSEEGLRRLIASTCAYAKRQRTWFGAQRKAVSIRGGSLQAMLDQALAALSHETAAA